MGGQGKRTDLRHLLRSAYQYIPNRLESQVAFHTIFLDFFPDHPMTFLNPFVLFGLAAAAIPVVIHLLNRRKLATIDFSSLRFLKELQHTSIRRLKIRQLILLLLRTLVIVALVLAFSRPALRGSLAGMIGGRAATTMVIVLDDSPSMTVRNEHGMVFSQAKDAATAILNAAREGDRVHLLRLSDAGPPGDRTQSVEQVPAARAALQRMTPSQRSVPFARGLAAARTVVTESHDPNREVYLISDFQASQFTGQPPDSAAPIEPAPRIFLVPIPSGKQENAGIGSLERKTQILSKGRPVQMQTVIRNFGSLPMHGSLMSVYLDGSRVVQQSLDIQPQSSSSVPFTLIPKRRGIVLGSIQLEDDALEIDNSRSFVLRIPDRIRVLMAGASARETRFPYLALTLAGDSSMAGLFAVERIDGEQLATTDLAPFDVLLLCGLRAFAQADAERISAFAKSGGGVLLFPGDEANLKNYSTVLLPRLGIPPLETGRTDSAGAQLGKSGGFITFNKVDLEHPLFSGLFEGPRGKKGQAPSVETPRIVRTAGIRPSGVGHSIIDLANGEVFLAEYEVGSGTVLVFAVDAGLSWSDFPVKGLFAPLLHRSVISLGSQAHTPPDVTVGEPVKATVKLRHAVGRTQYVLRAPSGIDERVAPRLRSATALADFESAPTVETGTYTLLSSDAEQTTPGPGTADPLEAVPVHAALSESDFRTATPEELIAFWRSVGISPDQTKELAAGGALETTIQQSRFGVELWRYFLGLALILAVAEMAVAREKQTNEQQQVR